jgi:hypothetical protein
VEFVTCKAEAETLPNWTVKPGRKLLPEIVTAVPPATVPLVGEMPEMDGAGAGEIINEKPAEAETFVASCT